MNTTTWALALALGVVLLGAGYYIYTKGGFTPAEGPGIPLVRTLTLTETVRVPNGTLTVTTTSVQTQTLVETYTQKETQVEYAPAAGMTVSAFKVNYYTKSSTEYKNLVANISASLLNTKCNQPLTVIDPQWPTSTSSKYAAAKARAEIVYGTENECKTFKNLSSGNFGLRVCVVGTPGESGVKYTTSNRYPKLAIVDGVIVAGDTTGLLTHKIPCPTTKSTTIYIYRINETRYDLLRVTVDCCGVTSIGYSLNTQFIIPLQSVDVSLPITIDTATVLMMTGAILIATGVFLNLNAKPRRKRRK
ncbi:MAG: hypothetical protein NZ992_00220 [Candidatus Korarchaeum sp.]|nr:hypothetical protein [Candidatus Korarchaeum sp.]MDW8093346.1 hypothetical protein [Nitrososphaerota archaeon]